MDTGNNPSRAWVYEVSGNYFDVLGLQPHLGRFFSGADEHGPNSAPYIVLTHAYWHIHFQDDRSVVGRVVRLNKHPFTILGVAPPEFHGTLLFFSPDFFLPMVNQEQIEGRSNLNARGARLVFQVMGHLKPGVTPAQAAADLNSIGSWLEKNYPKDDSQADFSLGRPSLAGDVFARPLRAFVTALMLLAGLILLAACANLGNLFAARAADRGREVALRLALGASRNRILRTLFTEAFLISLMGGTVGLLGGVALLRWLSVWQPVPRFPMHVPVVPDANVYAIALALALVSGFLFGIVPVRQVLRANPYQIVKGGSTGTAGRRITVRDLLLAAQIAICAVLVTSSLVAVRGLARSLHSNFGFEPRNAMLVNTNLAMAGYRVDEAAAMQKRMRDAVETIPGVKAVGLVDNPPLAEGWKPAFVFTDGTTDLRPANAAATVINYGISPEYLDAAGTALLVGRPLSRHDDKDAPRVALVNRLFANKIFGSVANAMSGYYKIKDGTRIQVVGVVEDGKYTTNIAEDPQAAMFLPILQSPSSRDLAGSALQPRSAPARGGHQEYAARLGRRAAFLHPNLDSRNGRSPVRYTRSDGVAGSAGHYGCDALHHRHLWHGGVLGQQAAARVGNPSRPRCAAKRSVAGSLGTGFQTARCRLGGWSDTRNSGQPRIGAHCVSGHSPRSAGIVWRRRGDAAAGAVGHLDSGATRAVGGSFDAAA